MWGSDKTTRLRKLLTSLDGCYAQIDQHRYAIFGFDEHIARLQIALDDAGPMRGI